MSTRSRSAERVRAPLPLWSASCFLVSGAAGLLYEVVWSKVLSQVLGNSLQAISTVVAVFLAGLALGAALIGRWSAARDGRRIYAWLEFGIAALGIVSVFALRGLDGPIGALHAATGGSGPGLLLGRIGLVALVLLPPTMLMGATLPALVGSFEPERLGPMLAKLYAINTIGAVVGTLLGGFALLPTIGLRGTSFFAVCLNIVAALIALQAVRRNPANSPAAGTEGRAAAPRVSTPESEPASQRILLAVALPVSGFAALLFQVAWFRLYGAVLGSSVYSFSGVLGVYLVGLALGSAFSTRWLARGGTLGSYALLQAVLALAAAISIRAFPLLPEWNFTLANANSRWLALFVQQLGIVAVVVLVPCLMLGAIFPLGLKLLGGRGASGVGHGYALNTLGTIAGALLGGYLIVPALGVQGTHVLALAMSGAVAAIAALLVLRTPAARTVAIAALVATAVSAVAVVTAPAWNPILMSAGVYRAGIRSAIGEVSRGRPGPPVLASTWRDVQMFYQEGEHNSVLTTRDSLTGEIALRLNGKVDASTGDMETQVLSGLIPGALADSGARTMVIGYGSGVTLSAVLAAGAGRTDLIELEPAVLEGARFFHEEGRDPRFDPRVTVRIEDGRTSLARSRETFDIIISEPSNPWLAGLNNLFTRDFYALVRSRLSERSVFCQWIQLYEISPKTFASILKGFLDVFPNGQAFATSGGGDLLLVAMDQPRPLDVRRLNGPDAQRELKRGKFQTPMAIASAWMASFKDLAPLVAGARPNRDDLPYVEYQAPRDLVEQGQAQALGAPSLASTMPHGTWEDASVIHAAWTPSQWFTERASQYARSGLVAETDRTIGEAARQRGPGLADSIAQAVSGIRRRRQAAELVVLARVDMGYGRTAEGIQKLRQSVGVLPGFGTGWALLAEALRTSGDKSGSRVAIDSALAVGTDKERANALTTLGMIAADENRLAVAADIFAEAARIHPTNAMLRVYEARAHFAAGQRDAAIRAYELAKKISPDLPDLQGLRQQLGL